MNITLIGMSRAGKSSVGKALAKRLGYAFVDLDLRVEAMTGQSIQDLLDTKGDEAYLKFEEDATLSLGGIKNTVVSPGGSIIYAPKAMDFLKTHSTVIFIDAPYERIAERMASQSRPLVYGAGKSLQTIYDERRPLYAGYADLTFISESEDVDEAARRVEVLVKEKAPA